MANWKVMIVGMGLINNAIHNANRNALVGVSLPELDASIEEIRAIQKKLKVKLSKGYKDFLLHSNGWEFFYQDVDLFGTGDLEPDSDKMKRAMAMLEIKMAGNSELRKMKGKILPIAASRDDDEGWLILLVTEGKNFGKIIWFVEENMGWVDSFEDFFIAMMECNRDILESVLREQIAAGKVPDTVWMGVGYPFRVVSKQHLEDLRTGKETYYPLSFKPVGEIIFERENYDKEKPSDDWDGDGKS